MIEGKNCINCRIECDGYMGTIKYVGPVKNTKGEWLGIDWDDSTRGKHNGTYEGLHYFDTWHSTSGSFIRPQKANFGISCPEAIRVRYGYVDDELAGFDKNIIESVQKSLNAPFVEMVGFSKVNKKQSKFNELKIVCLQEECVSSSGKPGELYDLCQNVEELDLTKNLFNNWKTVAEICSQLPHLWNLNVSDNYLPINQDVNIKDHKSNFLNVRHLTLVRMKYDWNRVMELSQAFTALEQLLLSVNVIEKLIEPIPESNLLQLTELALDENLISDWDEVLKLGHLPRLASLNLNFNQIKFIRFPSSTPTEKTHLFPSLKQLNISNNKIKEWRSVSELEKLKLLEDLKLRENPVLLGESLLTLRQLIIARITNLKILNGAEISPSDRRGAEYDYIKSCSSEWIKTNDNAVKRIELIENHPRMPALIEKYGVIEVKQTKRTTDLASDVIVVEFSCPDIPEYSNGIKRRIMKNMEVQKLMGIVQRLYGIHGGKMPTLSLIRTKVSYDEILLDKPLQEVSYYFIEDGDHILVRW